jgi:hypothetical protein
MGEQASGLSDVYSLGAVLYELLTGEVVFPGESFMAVALKHASEPPPSVLERRPDCLVRLAAAVERCLAKDPKDRFASMRELVDELEACLRELDTRGDADATLIIAPLRKPRAPARDRRRRRALPALVLIAALGALAAVIAIVVVERESIKRVFNIGSRRVTMTASRTFDPYGDNGTEEPQTAYKATDDELATYWTTESYITFAKPGVGLVVRAPKSEELTEMTVGTDTPRVFLARIRAGPSPVGPFVPVSDWQRMRPKTTFHVDTRGKSYRYYLIWLRLPSGGVAHVNDVTARAK